MYFCTQTSHIPTKGLLTLLTLLVFSLSLTAQSSGLEFEIDETYQGDSLTMLSIEEVVITATRNKFNVISPMPTQLLQGKELEKLNSLSVADAIRYFSGVQLKDYGGVGGIKTINVRSLGSAHTAVFYDGMTVGNAQNAQVDLSKYSLDNIEAIELYNGQKSSIFQPARGFFSSNSLYLRSKTPRFEKDEKNHIRAAFKTGSFGLLNPSILYQQKITSDLSLSASAELVDAHGRYKYRYKKEGGYDTTAVRQNGNIRSLRTELTFYLMNKNIGKASLKGYTYNSERGLPGAIVANRFSHNQRQWDRNIFVHASLENSFFKNHGLLANIKFSRDYNRYVDPEYVTLEGALDNRYYQSEWYASLVNKYSIANWWEASLATDFSKNTLSANLYRFPYPTRYSYFVALSTQMQWERIHIQASMLGAYVDEQVEQYYKGDNQKVFNPVISASVQPFETSNFRIRAFYKESFRMPTFNDLYYTFVGNSSLRPEFTKQYDVGATWIHNNNSGLLRTASIQADVYYNRVTDKIVAMPSSNLFRWTMMNLGEVEIKGLEVNTDTKFDLPKDFKLNLGLSYTYQKAIDITPKGSTYGDQIPYTPIHSGTVTSFLGWREWDLHYSFIYTGERYSQKANIPVNYVQPWYTHDLAVGWEGKLLRNNLRLSAEVNNVFNQYYDVILNFPMPGRNFRFNLSITI